MEGDLYGGLGVAPLDMRSLASSASDVPPANTKDAVKVSYLVSSQFAGAVVHFFQTVESAQQGIDNVHRQRRTFGLVDLYDYSADIHTGVTRCVMVSKIEEVSLPSRDMRVLLGPFTEFDVLCQGSSMLDFIRTVGALYSPHAPGNPMILLQLEDKHQKALYSNSSQSTPPAVPMKSVRCRVFRGKLGGADAAPAAAAPLAAASAEPAAAAHHTHQPAPSSSSQQQEHEQEQQPQQLQQPPPPPPLGPPPPQASQQQQQQRPPPHGLDTVPTLPPGPPADIFSSRLEGGDSTSVVEAAAAAYGARTAGATGPAGQHDLRMKVMRLEEELQLKARREAQSEDSLRREVVSLRDELRRLSPQQQQQQRQLAPPHAQPPQHQQPNPPPPAGPPPVWLEAYKQSPAPQQQPPPTFSDPQQQHTPKVLSPSYLRAQGRVAETPPFARKPPPGSAPYQVGRPHALPPGGGGGGASGGVGAGSPGSIWGF